jgi:uncharacterized iron-regulated membrane protein
VGTAQTCSPLRNASSAGELAPDMVRKIIFWSHLTAGVIAGLAIAIMSLTGAALAFEKQLVAWAERDARQIDPPGNNVPKLSLDELLQRVRSGQPDLRITSIAVTSDDRTAVALGLPGNRFVYANPYSASVREAAAPRMRAFMRTMQAWHVRLNFAPGPGNAGRTINAAANTVFLFLCVSGLVLWWPRAWNGSVLRRSLWFVSGARGKSRDWNWHNVFGFWSLPVLTVLVASGIVLSYRWANNLVFQLAGESPPVPEVGAPRPSAPRRAASALEPGAGTFAGFDKVMADLAEHVPNWKSIALRFNPPLQGSAPSGDTFIAAVRAKDQWPVFTNRTLTLDARTSAVRRSETFADQTPGQRARRWLRLLHTGEAFGWPGQFVAGVVSLGGVMLVWTGLSLACRRFFGRAQSS